jgi:hypothetical protein
LGYPIPPFPSYPGGPAPAPSPGDDVLPFAMGSNIKISSPDLPELFCDVKDAGWGHSSQHIKKKDKPKPVLCDRLGPDGPGTDFQQVGFTIISEDVQSRALKSGSKVSFSSMVTHKACRYVWQY